MKTKLPLPDKSLEQHISVLGKTGSGKTTTSKLIIEDVVERGCRVCVLDPIKSDWWGVTSSADGKRAGLPFYILGGPRGHLSLNPVAGAAIGELVATGQLPLSIIDMADFPPGGVQRFFVDFADTLLKKMRGVLYLVLEEAHEFAPKERAGFERENMAIHFAKKLATAGRSKGVRLILATQRTQSLHNALLGSCDTMIAHRFTAPADKKPVVDWLKSNLDPEQARTVDASMSSLRTGEAWVCSGESGVFQRHQFPRISTYDNSATPTNDSAAHEVKTAAVDREKLVAIIGTAIAEAESNDPSKLKAEIAKLNRELTNLRSAPRPQSPASASVVVPVLTDDDRKEFRELREQVLGYLPQIAEHREILGAIEAGVIELREVLDRALKPLLAPKTKPSGGLPGYAPISKLTPPNASKVEGGPTGGLRRMMVALAQRGTLNARQLGVRAGLSSSSGTFGTYLAAGRSNGWISGDRNQITITDEGFAALGTFEPLPEGSALCHYWLNQLSGGERRMLQCLCDSGETLTAEQLGDLAGISASSGTFGTYLSHLRTLELVTGKRDALRASEELFD